MPLPDLTGHEVMKECLPDQRQKWFYVEGPPDRGEGFGQGTKAECSIPTGKWIVLPYFSFFKLLCVFHIDKTQLEAVEQGSSVMWPI